MLGTLGSGLMSYLAARRSTDVQLKGVVAEMQRLRATHAEEHRQERQAVYHAFTTLTDEINQFAYGIRGDITEEAYLELVNEFGRAHTNLLLLGTQDVIRETQPMLELVSRFATAAAEANTSMPVEQRIRQAHQTVQGEWGASEGRMIEAMKRDITAARELPPS